jgi:hypothetical protein
MTIANRRVAYVFYRVGAANFGEGPLRKVASFAVPFTPLDTLEGDPHLVAVEKVWAAMNRGSGAENPFAMADNRSMSVGDVVVLDNMAFEAAMVGFVRIDMSRLLAELETVKFAKWPEVLK